MKEDGTFYSISKKWLPISSYTGMPPKVADESTLSNPLKIYTEDSPPANYIKDGKPAGMSVDIVRDILKRLGKKVEIEVVPWSRAYQMALSRPNASLFSTTRLPQREKLFKWVGPLYSQMWGFYAKRGSGIKIHLLEDTKKINRIGTYRNGVKKQFLKKRGFTNRLISAMRSNLSNIMKTYDFLNKSVVFRYKAHRPYVSAACNI